MRVKTPQPAETLLAYAHALEVGQHDRARVAYDYVLDVARAIHQHAYLPAYFVRDFRELPRELLRDDLVRRDAPVVKLFQALNLVLLETLKITLNIANSYLLHCPAQCFSNYILHDTAAGVQPPAVSKA